MKCSQCQRPALYVIGDAGNEQPLCLTCWSTFEDVQFRKFLQLAAMANQALDDMDAMVPIGPSGGRIPVADIARAASRSKTYNNIQITNSNVGVVNTGNLARIDAAITITKGTEAEEFGARLKDLAEAILSESKISAEVRKQMVEVAQAISDQAISKKPSGIVVTSLFGTLRDLAKDITVIAVAVEKLHEAWTHLQDMF